MNLVNSMRHYVIILKILVVLDFNILDINERVPEAYLVMLGNITYEII